MKDLIIRFIDFFYFIFKPIMPLKTYRYAVCGASNLVLDMVMYYVFFHFIFAKQNVDMHFFVFSPHIASLFFVFPITFVSGFLMNKFISFPDSELKTQIQFSRYLMITLSGLVISYIALKFFVDLLGFYPTPSRLLTITLSVAYSYFLQNKWSFK